MPMTYIRAPGSSAPSTSVAMNCIIRKYRKPMPNIITRFTTTVHAAPFFALATPWSVSAYLRLNFSPNIYLTSPSASGCGEPMGSGPFELPSPSIFHVTACW